MSERRFMGLYKVGAVSFISNLNRVLPAITDRGDCSPVARR